MEIEKGDEPIEALVEDTGRAAGFRLVHVFIRSVR